MQPHERVKAGQKDAGAEDIPLEAQRLQHQGRKFAIAEIAQGLNNRQQRNLASHESANSDLVFGSSCMQRSIPSAISSWYLWPGCGVQRVRV